MRFREEHRAALDWLNDLTSEDIQFFGLEIELWRIGDSPCAPKFNIACKPNDWVQQVHTSKGSAKALSDDKLIQHRFLTHVAEFLSNSSQFIQATPPKPRRTRVRVKLKSGFNLSVFAGFEDHLGDVPGKRIPNIRVEITFRRRKMDKYLALKESLQSLIDSIGKDLRHSINQNETVGRFYKIRTDIDLSNEDEWPKYCKWLEDNLKAFEVGFAKEFKILEQDEELDE